MRKKQTTPQTPVRKSSFRLNQGDDFMAARVREPSASEAPAAAPTLPKRRSRLPKASDIFSAERPARKRELNSAVIAEPSAPVQHLNEAAPRVFSAEFALGVTSLDALPSDDLPQVAFFGRSNVGKSSLLSALMGKKGLVKVSAAPGKTREINFFRVNGAFYFVDLPGIGYAKVSMSKRDEMAVMIREYVERSPHLRGIVYLVDIRHAGTPLDIQTVEILRSLGKPVLLVASKRDKLGQGAVLESLRIMQERFALDELPLAVSAHSKVGFEELWENLLQAVVSESL